MQPVTWPCPDAAGALADEYALTFPETSPLCVLLVPALFDEGNKLRRFAVQTMRALLERGIASVLPDYPGTNESLRPLAGQTIEGWQNAMRACAAHFGVTHSLGLRAGCLFTPMDLPAIHYAPTPGSAVLRTMLRARVLASREAGRTETREALESEARRDGIDLAGYPLGPEFFRGLDALTPAPCLDTIALADLGGAGLWLSAEPDEDAQQAQALAQRIAQIIRGPEA